MSLKTITLSLVSRLKISKKKIIATGLVCLFILLIAAAYFAFQQSDQTPQVNLPALLSGLSLLDNNEPEEDNGAVVGEEGEKESRFYRETARAGEGVTHLARRAIKSYLEKEGLDFTPEHRVYAEDYVKNRTSNDWLMLGEEVAFSEDLISEAVSRALDLEQNQLDNLKQYSALVTSF